MSVLKIYLEEKVINDRSGWRKGYLEELWKKKDAWSMVYRIDAGKCSNKKSMCEKGTWQR